MKICIITNCQRSTIRDSLRLLLPESRVTSVQSKNNIRGLAENSALGDADVYVVGRKELIEPIRSSFPGVATIYVPPVVFSGFHPDVVYAQNETGFIKCAGSSYHSSIVLWSYLNGIEERDAIKLFSFNTFQNLGFISKQQIEGQALKRKFETSDVNFRKIFRSIRRRGVFMHTINHPKAFVLCEISRQIAARVAPENVQDIPIEDLVSDFLSGVVWPIYPEIGDRLGVRSGYAWKVGRNHYPSLKSYVTAAYTSYNEQSLTSVQCGRIEEPIFDCVLRTAAGV